ncbi:aldo/keto reductase [Brachybacterium sp. YJGR34]|uniref:aldo/keto reductase n=1 Tax=Brachybacterium sp. YJGR34 TaxID=2059911 RepID=UPI000E0B70E3|nr:aldo/keto reductase [Brachybacterium sp. YJGR34]
MDSDRPTTPAPSLPIGARPLPGTALDAGPLTLGTTSLGADTAPGSAEEAQAVELATAMLHGPYALIDTSNAYAGGRSEAVLGLALREAGIAEGRAIVTKVDADPTTGAFDRDRVLRSVEESRERLGLDTIGLLHLHDPYGITVEEGMAAGGPVAGLQELKEQGVVGAIGIAAGKLDLMHRYVGTGAFDAVLNHNRFTLADRSATALFEEANKRGMGVFNAAPFGGALLAKGSASGATYAYQQPPAELVAWVRRVEELCARHGITLPAAALQFSLRSPLVHSTVVGISSAARIEQLEQLRTVPVPEAFWEELEALERPATGTA